MSHKVNLCSELDWIKHRCWGSFAIFLCFSSRHLVLQITFLHFKVVFFSEAGVKELSHPKGNLCFIFLIHLAVALFLWHVVSVIHTDELSALLVGLTGRFMNQEKIICFHKGSLVPVHTATSFCHASVKGRCSQASHQKEQKQNKKEFLLFGRYLQRKGAKQMRMLLKTPFFSVVR